MVSNSNSNSNSDSNSNSNSNFNYCYLRLVVVIGDVPNIVEWCFHQISALHEQNLGSTRSEFEFQGGPTRKFLVLNFISRIWQNIQTASNRF